jgi:hypothetical protein
VSDGRYPKTLGAISVLFLACAQLPGARADSDTCLARVALFVRELDELLEKEKYDSGPYSDLAERSFPFRDCEAEALLDVVRQSRFIRSIQHSPRTEEYHIRSNGMAWEPGSLISSRSESPGRQALDSPVSREQK